MMPQNHLFPILRLGVTVAPNGSPTMTKNTIIIAALTLTISLASAPAFAGSYSLDSKGKCHDDHGKFAKASFCKAAPVHCRDIKTKKFAKCDAPGTEPVPMH